MAGFFVTSYLLYTILMSTASGYELFFSDHSGVKQLVVTGWDYFEFSQRVSSPWNHLLKFEFDRNDDRLDFIRNTLERDYILEAYRTDETTGEKTKVYEGLHITTVDQVTNEGIVQISMYGVGFTDLLTRRIVLPPSGQETNDKSGVAETIMKEFVDESAITPTDTDRVFTGLTNAASSGSAGTAAYSARYTNLFTVISRCAEQGGVDFGIIGGDNTGEFVFRVADLWENDRTFGNSAGNEPTVFDLFFNNMEIPIYSKSGGDVKNFVYIGGQGQGVDREIRTLQEAADVAVSPWNRREAFVDARNQETTAGIDTTGQAYLEDNGYREKFTFNLRQTEGTRWLRDWNLGSLITARYFGLSFNKKIVEVRVVISAGDTGSSQEEIISAEMEDV